MVEENFEIGISEMLKSALKPEKILELVHLKCSNIYFFQSTMVGENFGIGASKMPKIALKLIHHGWRKIWKLHI